jgi:hypothetical protein
MRLPTDQEQRGIAQIMETIECSDLERRCEDVAKALTWLHEQLLRPLDEGRCHEHLVDVDDSGAGSPCLACLGAAEGWCTVSEQYTTETVSTACTTSIDTEAPEHCLLRQGHSVLLRAMGR